MTADPNLLSVPSSLPNLLTMLDCCADKAENNHVLIGNSQQTLSSTASQRKLVHHLHCTSGKTCTNAVPADLGIITKKELAVHNYLQKKLRWLAPFLGATMLAKRYVVV